MISPRVGFHSLREIARQAQAVRVSRKRLGFDAITAADLDASKGSPGLTSFFILGSGESVLRLTTENWEMVRSGISVGIGAWALHDFIPDFLAIESALDAPRAGAQEVFAPIDSSYRRSLEVWSQRTDVIMRKPGILFFRPKNEDGDSRLSPLGHRFADRTYLYGRYGAAARSKKELENEFSLYLRLSRLGAIPEYLAFDTGGTVTRLISLALRAGFSRIVLAGVDLKDSQYFWEADPSYLRKNGINSFVSGQQPGLHRTEKASRGVPASAAISALSEVAKARMRCNIQVAHRSSWMANHLEVFDWTQ